MKKSIDFTRMTKVFIGQNAVSAFFFWLVRIFIRPKIYGLEKLRGLLKLHKSSGLGIVFVSNHINKSDPLLILHSMPLSLKVGLGAITFLGKEGLFNKPWKDRLMRSLGVVPVRDNSLLGLRGILKLIEKGEKIFYFPEGTVSKDGNLGEDSGSANFYAKHAKFILQPVRVSGMRGWKKDWKNIFCFRRKYTICFLEPLIVERGTQINALAETQKGTQNYVSDAKVKGD